MDCHVFRRLCDELVPFLKGARFEKITEPAPHLVAFLFYSQGKKQTLFLRFGKCHPFIFLSSSKVAAPVAPPAYIMRLRKYFQDRRIVEVRILWQERRIAVSVKGTSLGQYIWLDLSLKDGPTLFESAPYENNTSVNWPEINSLSDIDWRVYPVFSPALRKTLPFLESAEQQALIADLELGGGDLFVYIPSKAEKNINQLQKISAVYELSAWPLPSSFCEGRSERVFESSVQATTFIGENSILSELAEIRNREDIKQHNELLKKYNKLIDKLNNERQRLEEMTEKKYIALALQAELYRFSSKQKCAKISLNGFSEKIRLNPALTVRENMEKLFHQAERGERGLIFLKKRIESICLERDRMLESIDTISYRMSINDSSLQKSGKKSDGKWPSNIQRYYSSDGLLILRGRDAQGNAYIVRMAAPYDIWVHIGGAAGAHVLIRRNHSVQEIPETTLLQAGWLAVEKSERKGEIAADVVVTQARYVRSVKGNSAGAVRIDKVERSLEIVMSAVNPPQMIPL